MDARRIVVAFSLFAAVLAADASAQHFVMRRAVVETPHFRVFCGDANLAQEVAQAAEGFRSHLAKHWLGEELGNWHEKCPIQVQSSPNMLASGETKYTLVSGSVRHFEMVVAGSRERILDSVLPHEITHTILATHFAVTGKPVPRWADEGACTTVEHASERTKHDHMLVRFLSEGRGIPFASLFAMRDYPADMMPLYAQGYSLCAFLIAQGGPRQFIAFLESGMQTEDWVGAVEQHYQYPRLGKLQTAWNDWVRDGGGTVVAYTATARGFGDSNARVASNAIRSEGPVRLAAAELPAPHSPTLSRLNESASMPGLTDLNNSMNPSVVASNPVALPANPSNNAGSYYLERFRQHQANNAPSSKSNTQDPNRPDLMPVPHQVSQPAPFQSLGGTIYR